MHVFQEVVMHAKQDVSGPKHRDSHPDQMEFYNKLEQLRPMMREEGLDRCFQFFRDEIWHREHHRHTNLVKALATDLLRGVAEEKAKDMYSDKWPSTAQIIEMLQQIGSPHAPQLAGKMILDLIEGILATTSLQIDVAKKQELLEDLVDTWIVFSRHGLNPDTSSVSTSQEAQFRLPELNGTQLRYLADRNDFLGALGLVFGHADWSNTNHFRAATLATFVLLVDSGHSNASIRLKARPFLVSVGRVLAAIPKGPSILPTILASRPQILSYAIKVWKPIVTQLNLWNSHPNAATSDMEDRIISGNFAKDVAMDPEHFQRQLSRALLMGSAAEVEATWTKYWGEKDMPDEVRATQMRRHQALFNAFILAFTAVRRTQRALDVWDAMARIGVPTTLDTWEAMLEGFKKAKNVAGLEGAWKKLLASGAQLNEKIWRTRISGLMESREPEAGLRALKELAEQSKRPNAVPFNIDVVNSVVLGLIRLNNAMPVVREVLQWASEYNAPPDIFTYNILLRPMVQEGNSAQIQRLLQLMQAQGIPPDVTTFTIFLDGIVIAGRDKSPDEKVEMYRGLVQDMESADITPNMDIIGRLIHLIIKDGQQTARHTQGAVGAILQYAKKRNIKLSRHVYTILVEYYLSQTPPAVREVDQLLSDHKLLVLNATSGLDRIFWERVVSGFAAAGEVDRAFNTVRRIQGLGTAMTLDSLHTVLQGLVNRGRTEDARELATRVAQERLAQEKVRDYGDPGRFWRHRFWGLASDYKLYKVPRALD